MVEPYENRLVVVVGGAVAGSRAARRLAEAGANVLVCESNAQPYGKIDDGLPRWHGKLQTKERKAIDSDLSHERIRLVTGLRIGPNLPLGELLADERIAAVLLAHGAWRDRPMTVPGADELAGHGLMYQNDFIYRFNHDQDPPPQGGRLVACDGAVVVGGGLASIDVAKAITFTTVQKASAERGHEIELETLETAGVDVALERVGLTYAELGLKGVTLLYRRRIEDMSLSPSRPGADRAKTEASRLKIAKKAQAKYRFRIVPRRKAEALHGETGSLTGISVCHTEVDSEGKMTLTEVVEKIETPQVISSIGSVPEALDGLPMIGDRVDADDHGKVNGVPKLFALGNAVTGKGNIIYSRRNAELVAGHVAKEFLGRTEEVEAAAVQGAIQMIVSRRA